MRWFINWNTLFVLSSQGSPIVIAHIRYSYPEIIVSVNFRPRRDNVRQKLRSLLKDSVTSTSSRFVSREDLVEIRATAGESPALQFTAEQKAELQKVLEARIARQMENWEHEPIPMLDDLTPLEASKTKRGRELLEALFLSYESNDRQKKAGNADSLVMTPDIAELRARVGMLEFDS